MFSLKRENIFCNAFASKILASAICVLLLSLFSATSGALAQTGNSSDGDDFPVPDTYRVEGIPAIKKSEVENLFYDPSSIRSNLIWDADSKNRRLLVTDEKNSVYLLDAPMAQPARLTDGFVPNKVKVRSDGAAFAYSSDREDENNYQLYFYDLTKKTPEKLTTLTGKDESVDSFTWNKTGDSLFYTKVDYDAKTSQLCQSNLSAEVCFPADLKGIWTVVEADGDYVLLRYAKASSSHFLYAYDMKAKKLTPIDEQGDTAKAFLFGTRVFRLSEGNDLRRTAVSNLQTDG